MDMLFNVSFHPISAMAASDARIRARRPNRTGWQDAEGWMEVTGVAPTRSVAEKPRDGPYDEVSRRQTGQAGQRVLTPQGQAVRTAYPLSFAGVLAAMR